MRSDPLASERTPIIEINRSMKVAERALIGPTSECDGQTTFSLPSKLS